METKGIHLRKLEQTKHQVMFSGRLWNKGFKCVKPSLEESAHFGVVSLLHLFLVQLDLGIVLLSHLMKGLSQLVLILNLTPRIHLYQASFMLPSGLINLLRGAGNDIKPSYLP